MSLAAAGGAGRLRAMLMRRIISGWLVLVLLVAGQALAVARGQAPAATEVVLCTGFGTQVVHLDAEGNPVSTPGLCPHGLARLALIHGDSRRLWQALTTNRG